MQRCECAVLNTLAPLAEWHRLQSVYWQITLPGVAQTSVCVLANYIAGSGTDFSLCSGNSINFRKSVYSCYSQRHTTNAIFLIGTPLADLFF